MSFCVRLRRGGIKCIKENRHTQRPICANLDFYSGFIYEMIGIPPVAGRQVPSVLECRGAGDCGTHPSAPNEG